MSIILNNNQRIAVHLIAQGKTGKFISENLNKDNDLDKYLPQIVNIFRDLSLHWSSLNKKSQRSFNNLIFPQGISFTLEGKITPP